MRVLAGRPAGTNQAMSPTRPSPCFPALPTPFQPTPVRCDRSPLNPAWTFDSRSDVLLRMSDRLANARRRAARSRWARPASSCDGCSRASPMSPGRASGAGYHPLLKPKFTGMQRANISSFARFLMSSHRTNQTHGTYTNAYVAPRCTGNDIVMGERVLRCWSCSRMPSGYWS
jgi:hypothetical protein